jgi:hypothetical protein
MWQLMFLYGKEVFSSHVEGEGQVFLLGRLCHSFVGAMPCRQPFGVQEKKP